MRELEFYNSVAQFFLAVASGTTAGVLANAIWRFVMARSPSGECDGPSSVTTIEIERTEVLELTPDSIRHTIVQRQKGLKPK